MKVTATGSLHPAFQIYESVTQNRAVWSRMPEFYWAAASDDAGSTATVLAKLEGAPGPGSQDRPLIAERYAGRGRVLFIGLDSTYRWRRNIGNHLFYRFWGQAIRHVARNKDRAGDSSWMEASPRRIEPGDAAAIELYAVDDDGEPLDETELSVQVTGEDRSDRVRLSRAPQKGYYRGLWQPRGIGSYRLSYTDERGKVVTSAVEVVRSGRELRRPIIDREALGTLADATGGGLLELDQISQLPGALKGEAVTVTKTNEESIWDNWLTLVLLVGLYCTDVGARRLLGLT
jgi:hypothetical protein